MKADLFEILDNFYINHKFESKKRRWYKKENDGFIICEFQKFKYGSDGSGFLNFGIVFDTAKNIKIPKGEESWDLRGRYKTILEKPNISELFSVEIKSEREMQELKLTLANIENIVIPYLVYYSKLDNLKNDLNNRRFNYSRALTKIQPNY
jgi:hypothetical protein